MKTYTASNSIKKKYISPVLLVVVYSFLLGELNPCAGKENEIEAELTDMSGNKIKISSIGGDKQIYINFFYQSSSYYKDPNSMYMNWAQWASVRSNIEKLQDVNLVQNFGRQRKLYKIRFIDNTEVLNAEILGTLSGKATVAGIPSVDVSISWSDIKDIAFKNIDKKIINTEKSGLSAHLKHNTGNQLDLFDITTIDTHENSAYYGFFRGDRNNVLPLILNTVYEVDIPLKFIRKISFNDSNKPLTVDIIYRIPGSQNDIILKEKKIGYAFRESGYDIHELLIRGKSWIGDWDLRIQPDNFNKLLSIEDFTLNPNGNDANKNKQETIQGICTTLDGKQWQIQEFRNFKLNISVGKSQVSFPYDKIKMLSIGQNREKLEITLVNGEKVTGEGNIGGGLISVDENGVITRFSSSYIKNYEKKDFNTQK